MPEADLDELVCAHPRDAGPHRVVLWRAYSLQLDLQLVGPNGTGCSTDTADFCVGNTVSRDKPDPPVAEAVVAHGLKPVSDLVRHARPDADRRSLVDDLVRAEDAIAELDPWRERL